MTPNKSERDADVLPGKSLGGAESSPGMTNREDEEWSKMGRQMRGDGPAQQSWDPLRDLMASPRAQSIERSLGVDN
jgi:hypothetical protein